MDVVVEALAGVGEQVAILSKACDELSHRELIELLVELTTVLRTIPAIEHRIVSRLTDETEPGALGEASWKKVLTTALRCSEKDAKRRLERAATLGPRRAMTGEPLAPLLESTAAAQARGVLDEEHVKVIADFHDALPSWVDAGTRADADRELARVGSGLGPEALRQAAGRLLGMIDQDGPEPTETDIARRCGVRLGPQRPDGTRSIRGVIDAETGALLEAILAKEAAPGANAPDDGPRADAEPPTHPEPSASAPESKRPDGRTHAQRNHDALKAVARRALEAGLGTHNGLPVTVIVSTTLQELEKGAGVAVTGGGSLLPMRDLIRLAAHAHHYLYVYDQHSEQSLYLGRAKRLATAAQRLALHAKERGCTRPGCSVPGYWAQVHHAAADWKDDGQTNIDDLTFACGADHRMLDNTGWRTRKNKKNQTEWLPPPDLDTGQHRINGYHHPERYLLPEDDDDNESEGP
ncbi:HNH endonuclease signature motif containing protein [Mycolicibacterium iranicum]|uniref:HNH endonuclease signature motif containing protein n=2 Tax=Mycolicibacterium iranicum TaxID=912594 RepID=A0ABT4HJ90_MYCIR|nr:HNH endonuclease signature motif containing protein [Mycolicibacterium iranicum]MCZ0730273.1 HNH endonuclease signature motif containing protein [Mycolicibacterium iranicum]